MAATAARRAAFEVLRRTFEHAAWADRAFRSAAERHGLVGRDRAFAQRLAFGAVKRRGTSDHFTASLARRPVERLDPPVRAALRLGLYELLWEPPGSEHATVGEAVELAKGAGEGKRRNAAAGLVNAVLRRAARERTALLASLDDTTPGGAATALSYPGWVAERLFAELGPGTARDLMRAMNEPAEVAFRVNRLRAERDGALGTLIAAGADASAPRAGGLLAPPDAVVVRGAWGAGLEGMLGAGELVAQSRASQAVIELLEAQPGDRVLDLCAGPGIKTTAIAARVGEGGEVRAVELDPGRASQIAELAERLGARAVRPEVADAAELDAGPVYDRVLVDPPCTDLGALASRPDARWRKTAEQAARLGELQRAILARGIAALAPGGTLVYSTCTISRAEGEDVVGPLLESTQELRADDLGSLYPDLASGHDTRFLQTRPDRDGTDGFFMARLKRAA
jgi:16S rRNA (cytosine967-C5)-methyltransferase